MGTRSDVYALGGILIKILTLRAPANGKTTTAVLRRKLNEKIKDPMLYNEEALGDNPDSVRLFICQIVKCHAHWQQFA